MILPRRLGCIKVVASIALIILSLIALLSPAAGVLNRPNYADPIRAAEALIKLEAREADW